MCVCFHFLILLLRVHLFLEALFPLQDLFQSLGGGEGILGPTEGSFISLFSSSGGGGGPRGQGTGVPMGKTVGVGSSSNSRTQRSWTAHLAHILWGSRHWAASWPSPAAILAPVAQLPAAAAPRAHVPSVNDLPAAWLAPLAVPTELPASAPASAAAPPPTMPQAHPHPHREAAVPQVWWAGSHWHRKNKAKAWWRW